MADLTNFVTLLNGEFDNKDQFEKMCKINPQYPYAKHINTICNSKIENLPKGFEGVFMIFHWDKLCRESHSDIRYHN